MMEDISKSMLNSLFLQEADDTAAHSATDLLFNDSTLSEYYTRVDKAKSSTTPLEYSVTDVYKLLHAMAIEAVQSKYSNIYIDNLLFSTTDSKTAQINGVGDIAVIATCKSDLLKRLSAPKYPSDPSKQDKYEKELDEYNAALSQIPDKDEFVEAIKLYVKLFASENAEAKIKPDQIKPLDLDEMRQIDSKTHRRSEQKHDAENRNALSGAKDKSASIDESADMSRLFEVDDDKTKRHPGYILGYEFEMAGNATQIDLPKVLKRRASDDKEGLYSKLYDNVGRFFGKAIALGGKAAQKLVDILGLNDVHLKVGDEDFNIGKVFNVGQAITWIGDHTEDVFKAIKSGAIKIKDFSRNLTTFGKADIDGNTIDGHIRSVLAAQMPDADITVKVMLNATIASEAKKIPSIDDKTLNEMKALLSKSTYSIVYFLNKGSYLKEQINKAFIAKVTNAALVLNDREHLKETGTFLANVAKKQLELDNSQDDDDKLENNVTKAFDSLVTGGVGGLISGGAINATTALSMVAGRHLRSGIKSRYINSIEEKDIAEVWFDVKFKLGSVYTKKPKDKSKTHESTSINIQRLIESIVLEYGETIDGRSPKDISSWLSTRLATMKNTKVFVTSRKNALSLIGDSSVYTGPNKDKMKKTLDEANYTAKQQFVIGVLFDPQETDSSLSVVNSDESAYRDYLDSTSSPDVASKFPIVDELMLLYNKFGDTMKYSLSKNDMQPEKNKFIVCKIQKMPSSLSEDSSTKLINKLFEDDSTKQFVLCMFPDQYGIVVENNDGSSGPTGEERRSVLNPNNTVERIFVVPRDNIKMGV